MLTLSGVVYAQGIFDNPKFMDYAQKNYKEITSCVDLTFDSCGKKAEEAAKNGDAQALSPFVEFIQKAATALGLPVPSADEITTLFKQQTGGNAPKPQVRSPKRKNLWGELDAIRKPIWELSQDRSEMDEDDLRQLRSSMQSGIDKLKAFLTTITKRKSQIFREASRTIKQWLREIKDLDRQIAELASEDHREKLEDIRDKINDAHRMDSYDKDTVVAKRNTFLSLLSELEALLKEAVPYPQLVREVKEAMKDINEHALRYLNQDVERYEEEGKQITAYLLRSLFSRQKINRNRQFPNR